MILQDIMKKFAEHEGIEFKKLLPESIQHLHIVIWEYYMPRLPTVPTLENTLRDLSIPNWYVSYLVEPYIMEIDQKFAHLFAYRGMEETMFFKPTFGMLESTLMANNLSLAKRLKQHIKLKPSSFLNIFFEPFSELKKISYDPYLPYAWSSIVKKNLSDYAIMNEIKWDFFRYIMGNGIWTFSMEKYLALSINNAPKDILDRYWNKFWLCALQKGYSINSTLSALAAMGKEKEIIEVLKFNKRLIGHEVLSELVRWASKNRHYELAFRLATDGHHYTEILYNIVEYNDINQIDNIPAEHGSCVTNFTECDMPNHALHRLYKRFPRHTTKLALQRGYTQFLDEINYDYKKLIYLPIYTSRRTIFHMIKNGVNHEYFQDELSDDYGELIEQIPKHLRDNIEDFLIYDPSFGICTFTTFIKLLRGDVTRIQDLMKYGSIEIIKLAIINGVDQSEMLKEAKSLLRFDVLNLIERIGLREDVEIKDSEDKGQMYRKKIDF